MAPNSPHSQLLVLDAWPVMEWFRGKQPAAASFRGLLASSAQGQYRLCISRINLGEIFYTTAKDFSEADGTALVQRLKIARVETVSVTDDDIDQAARWKSRYKISYADAFAAVLSISRSSPLVTGDPEFKALELAGLIQLHWLGK